MTENPEEMPGKQVTLKKTEDIPEIPGGAQRLGEGGNEGECVAVAGVEGAHGGGQAAITVMHWTAVDICGARSWG